MLPRSSKKHVSWKHRVPEDKRKRSGRVNGSQKFNCPEFATPEEKRKTIGSVNGSIRKQRAECRSRKKNGGVNGSKHVFQKWVTNRFFSNQFQSAENALHIADWTVQAQHVFTSIHQTFTVAQSSPLPHSWMQRPAINRWILDSRVFHRCLLYEARMFLSLHDPE